MSCSHKNLTERRAARRKRIPLALLGLWLPGALAAGFCRNLRPSGQIPLPLYTRPHRRTRSEHYFSSAIWSEAVWTDRAIRFNTRHFYGISNSYPY